MIRDYLSGPRSVWRTAALLEMMLAVSACTPPVVNTGQLPALQTREVVPMHRVEKLLALATSDEDLQIMVTSTGCTQARDFVVETETVDGICRVRIVRTRPDRCRRAPHPVMLTLPWGEAMRFPMERRVVTNPVVSADRGLVDR